jgi:hypothetical protein
MGTMLPVEVKYRVLIPPYAAYPSNRCKNP